MKKNKVLIIVVGLLLLVVGGLSFSYYVGKVLIEGNEASIKVTTAKLENSTVSVEGNIILDDNLEMLPGHKVIAKIKVTATGNNELITYNLIWKGINGLTKLKYEVYKPGKDLNVTTECQDKNKVIEGAIALYEECKINNYEELGTKISNGEISKSETEEKVILKADELITSSKGGTEEYYYVILEFPNENSNQNIDKNKNFSGKILVEASTTEPDINIMAMYLKDEETGKNNKIEKLPEEGNYALTSESKCNNEVTPIWDYKTKELRFQNFKLSGTNCYLYFASLSDATLAKLKQQSNGEKDSFDGPSSATEKGIWSAEDDDGKSYYFRGLVENNYVKFAGFYWRIIRINGDGSIRMIYAGQNKPEKANGECSDCSIGTSAFNVLSNDNMYVGFRYTDGDTHGIETESTILTNEESGLNKWYEDHILGKQEENHIEKSAGFCNDRTNSTSNQTSWGEQENNGGIKDTTTYYGARLRFMTKDSYKQTQVPILKCTDNLDLFTVKNDKSKGNQKLQYPIGLITVDEAIFAGGFAGTETTNYYLFIGEYYWTMSPYYFGYSNKVAQVFGISGLTGSIGNLSIDDPPRDVRPVINLRSDVEFKADSDGTINHPYEVVME